MTEPTLCISCNTPLPKVPANGEIPLHFKCSVPCCECQTLLNSTTLRISPAGEFFCAAHYSMQFLKKCGTCAGRLREDEPTVKIGTKFHHSSCLPQPEPAPAPVVPEPVPEPEPEPIPEPVETGNTVGALFHLMREELNKELHLKWMIHDIELSEFEAEVLLRVSGAVGSFLVYYTQNGRARDYSLLFWASADEIHSISILDNNFKYSLFGHSETFGFIGDMIDFYLSHPVIDGKPLSAACLFPEQYADPTEEDKKSPFVNEIVAIRGELALMTRLNESAVKLKSQWITKKDRAEQIADLDYLIQDTLQRIELAKTLLQKPDTSFGNDKFADAELLETAVQAFKASQHGTGTGDDDDTLSIASEVEEIEETEVPTSAELNNVNATLTALWNESDLVLPTGFATFENFVALVGQALPMRHRKVIEKRIKKRKDTSIASKKDELKVSHFIAVVRDLFSFPVLTAIFAEIAKTNPEFLTVLEFKNYLKTNKILLASEADSIVALFYKLANQNKKSKAQDPELAAAREMFGTHVAVTQDGFLTPMGFVQFMFTTGCAAFDPTHAKVYQDMSQPLTHYFVNSGHNSYLEADQLMGPSTTDAYRKALLAGARCVEIDLWDGPKGDPIVYHGHTLTSKISARSVLLAIKENAFVVSQYPVILSLENHLCLEQQAVFAKYCVDIFGDALVSSKGGFWETSPTVLPSPESLKKKIVIKNKAHPTRGEPNGDPASVKAAKIVAKEMSDIVVYCKSVSFSNMRKATDLTKCYEMSSFAEKKAFKLAREESTAFIRLTNNHFARTYPDGKRFDSSNYDPQPLWNVGIQMVALNFQTPDRTMHVNHAKFAENGGCGYVLKPAIFRNPGGSKALESTGLSIELIHGFQIVPPKSSNRMSRRKEKDIATYVEVEVSGIKTLLLASPVAKGGDYPTWNFKFEFNVSMPDMAVVRFTLLDDKTKEPMGSYSIAMSALQNGLRRIPLSKQKAFCAADPLPSSLFVNVTKA